MGTKVETEASIVDVIVNTNRTPIDVRPPPPSPRSRFRSRVM